MLWMDTSELQPAMVRFHLLRAQESKNHLDRLRALARELFPGMPEARADRLLAIIDEEVTRANLRWLQSAVERPEWPATATRHHLEEPGEDVRAG